jgi:hypothetical protein
MQGQAMDGVAEHVAQADGMHLRLAEVCQYVGRSPRAIQYWIKQGLPVAERVKSGATTVPLFRKADVDAFLATNGIARWDPNRLRDLREKKRRAGMRASRHADVPREDVRRGDADPLEQDLAQVRDDVDASEGRGGPHDAAAKMMIGARVNWEAMVKPLLTQVLSLQGQMPTGEGEHGAQARWSDSMRKLLGELRELDEKAQQDRETLDIDDAAAVARTIADAMVQEVMRAEAELISGLVRDLSSVLTNVEAGRPAIRAGVTGLVRALRNRVAKAVQAAEGTRG